MKPLLIVDCNNLCYRAWHSTGALSFKGKPTGVIYGFFSQLFEILRATKPGEVAFMWDSSKSRRKRRHAFYKNREKGEDLLVALAQFDEIRGELLPAMGLVNTFRATGFEADDLMARLARERTAANLPTVIVSSDEDLYQLISPSCSTYSPHKKEMTNLQTFRLRFGIEPKHWPLVKAIAGCTSDTIPGISGVGETTAIAYIRKKLKPESKSHQKIEAGWDTIERNLWLVCLPLVGTPPVEMQPVEFNERAWRQICRSLGFNEQSDFVQNMGVFFE